EDSSTDSERLASAPRTEAVCSPLPASASSLPATIGFTMDSISGRLRNGAAENVALCLVWRNAHCLHFIHVFDATSGAIGAMVDGCRGPISTCSSPLMCCSQKGAWRAPPGGCG